VNTTPVSKVTTQAKETLAIIGLGYVGLPLAVEFGKQYDTIGFDIDSVRIQQLKDGLDRTREVEPELLAEATGLRFTDQLDELRTATTYIVTVPTPIDAFKTPDLSPLRGASRTVAGVLKPGDTVIYESTVYPGATEEVCVPILEEGSGLTFNWDFFVGYSPERINPGDKERVARESVENKGTSKVLVLALAIVLGLMLGVFATFMAEFGSQVRQAMKKDAD
jgi:UDP-N-acetyl-D-galactosamine dehydrogenase